MAKENQANWFIQIKAPFAGFAPAWWKNSNTFVGNKNNFSSLTSIDFMDPNGLKQGPGIAKLGNSAAVTTLIKGITPVAVSANVAYAVGGNQLYKISATAVRNSASTWPITINHPTYSAESGESVIAYQGAVYAFYNHGNGGDVGKLTVATNSFDPDWGSTTPTGYATLQSAPHPAWVAADKLMFGNGRYVGSYDGTTFDDGDSTAGLDFKAGSEVVAGVYNGGWNYIAVNFPSIAGSNSNEATIYIWDGESASWEDTITLKGRIGAMLLDNGTIYVWYQEENADGGYKLGYIYGNSVKELETYNGSMPLYYQVCKSGGHLAWVSNGRVYAWGTSIKNKIAPFMFDYMDAGLAMGGGLGNPFGTLLVASTDGASAFQFNKASGLEITSEFYSLLYDVTNGRHQSMIDEIIMDFYPMSTGAKLKLKIIPDISLANSAELGSLSYATDGATAIRKHFYPKISCKNFKIKGDYRSGSATNSVQVRQINIHGHYLNQEG